VEQETQDPESLDSKGAGGQAHGCPGSAWKESQQNQILQGYRSAAKASQALLVVKVKDTGVIL
jgi:hypothetical protein